MSQIKIEKDVFISKESIEALYKVDNQKILKMIQHYKDENKLLDLTKLTKTNTAILLKSGFMILTYHKINYIYEKKFSI